MQAHTEAIASMSHDHIFDTSNRAAERGARTVMWITLLMMVIEIGSGYWFNSMALLADGWHMSSHALAIGLSAFAYAAARRYARDRRFAFGTWKIEILAGYTSAIFLAGIAALMIYSSIQRFISPEPIHYKEAILIGAIGLVVNIVCVFILGDAHHHGDAHDHQHDHQHEHGGHHDLNLKSAYVHVVADAATSLLALVALAGGWVLGWSWLDPTMGIIGALVVAAWAKNLIAESGKILLDREMDHPVVAEIREAAENRGDAFVTRVVDLHVLRVGKRSYSCALSVVTNDASLTPRQIRERITVHEEVVHTTIEIEGIGVL